MARRRQRAGPVLSTIGGGEEPPLGPIELAGIEAILVNLRVDAMIDLLENKGLLTRHDIEEHFMKLVQTRFVRKHPPSSAKKPPNAPNAICSAS